MPSPIGSSISSAATEDLQLLPSRWARHLPAPTPVWNALLTPFAVAALVLGAPLVPHRCLMQWLLHVPCPGCGVTTALRALLHGRLAGAWRSNPAGVVLGAALCAQVGSNLRRLHAPRDSKWRWPAQLMRLAMASLFAVWIARLSHHLLEAL